MVAYVRLVPRIGEHRRENLFLGGSSVKSKCFSFLQETIFKARDATPWRH